MDDGNGEGRNQDFAGHAVVKRGLMVDLEVLLSGRQPDGSEDEADLAILRVGRQTVIHVLVEVNLLDDAVEQVGFLVRRFERKMVVMLPWHLRTAVILRCLVPGHAAHGVIGRTGIGTEDALRVLWPYGLSVLLHHVIIRCAYFGASSVDINRL